MGLTLTGYAAIASLVFMGIAHVVVAARFGYLHPVAQKYLHVSLPFAIGIIFVGTLEARSWQWGGWALYGEPWVVTLVGGGLWIVLVGTAAWIRRR